MNYKKMFLVLMAAGILLLIVDHMLKWGVRTSQSTWTMEMIAAGIIAVACLFWAKKS